MPKMARNVFAETNVSVIYLEESIEFLGPML